MLRLGGGVLVGVGLGTNDTANIFGPGVAAQVIRYRQAVVLAGIFVFLGAAAEGPKCMEILSDLSRMTINGAAVVTSATAVVLLLMTWLGIPASSSQATVGAILGLALGLGQPAEVGPLVTIVICWLASPLGAGVIGFILYHLLIRVARRFLKSPRILNAFVRVSFVGAACYGAYTLGANNVANATGLFYGAGYLTALEAAFLGGAAMSLGGFCASRRVIITVGNRITDLGPLPAVSVVMAQAVSVHVFTQIGVPVSISQSVVGAVAGVGLVRGFNTIDRRTLLAIFSGWVVTPLSSGLLAFAGAVLLASAGKL